MRSVKQLHEFLLSFEMMTGMRNCFRVNLLKKIGWDEVSFREAEVLFHYWPLIDERRNGT